MKDTKQIIRELVEEVIEEMTATGAVAGYNTPRWGRPKTKGAESTVGLAGYTLVGKEEKSTVEEETPIVRRELNVMEEGYRAFKRNESMRNEAKVSYGLMEAKKMLREVEYLVGLCERLKMEGGYTNEQLWKRTARDVGQIHTSLKEIAKRINRMKKQ